MKLHYEVKKCRESKLLLTMLYGLMEPILLMCIITYVNRVLL